MDSTCNIPIVYSASSYNLIIYYAGTNHDLKMYRWAISGRYCGRFSPYPEFLFWNPGVQCTPQHRGGGGDDEHEWACLGARLSATTTCVRFSGSALARSVTRMSAQKLMFLRMREVHCACEEFTAHAWSSLRMRGVHYACEEFTAHARSSLRMRGVHCACVEFTTHAWSSLRMRGVHCACEEFTAHARSSLRMRGIHCVRWVLVSHARVRFYNIL